MLHSIDRSSADTAQSLSFECFHKKLSDKLRGWMQQGHHVTDVGAHRNVIACKMLFPAGVDSPLEHFDIN